MTFTLSHLYFFGLQKSTASKQQGFSRHILTIVPVFQFLLALLLFFGRENGKQKNKAMRKNMKHFESILTYLARSKGIREVFTDLIDFALFQLIAFDHGKLAKNPLPNYNQKDQSQLIELLKIMGDNMDNYNDALGDIFMEYLSFGKNGQFFTPTPICDLMAKMTIPKEATDGNTISDPTCGSGRILLAAAKINRNFEFHGSDVDLTCVKMTAINMAYNSLTSEIHWMNALTLDHYGTFRTTFCPITKIPYIITFPADKTISAKIMKETIAEMPIKQRKQATQLNLFDNL